MYLRNHLLLLTWYIWFAGPSILAWQLVSTHHFPVPFSCSPQEHELKSEHQNRENDVARGEFTSETDKHRTTAGVCDNEWWQVGKTHLSLSLNFWFLQSVGLSPISLNKSIVYHDKICIFQPMFRVKSSRVFVNVHFFFLIILPRAGSKRFPVYVWLYHIVQVELVAC